MLAVLNFFIYRSISRATATHNNISSAHRRWDTSNKKLTNKQSISHDVLKPHITAYHIVYLYYNNNTSAGYAQIVNTDLYQPCNQRNGLQEKYLIPLHFCQSSVNANCYLMLWASPADFIAQQCNRFVGGLFAANISKYLQQIFPNICSKYFQIFAGTGPWLACWWQ